MDPQHVQAVNRAIDYIQIHLAESLTITQLSKVACYSEYHFQRVFKAHIGETLQRYVNRLRLEKAAEMLRSRPDLTITDISLLTGFATSAAFAKAFKQQFVMNASQWRAQKRVSPNENTPPFTLKLKQGQPAWYWRGKTLPNCGTEPIIVQLENLPEFRIAYVRNIGKYISNESLFDQLYQRLFQWASSHSVLTENTLAYNFYSDSPDITANEKLQVLASITVDSHVKGKGDIATKNIGGGLYAVCRFHLKSERLLAAWSWIYDQWLPASGFLPDDRPAFERSSHKSDTLGVHTVDIGVPIKCVD